jgi:hypothetical protein
LNTQAPVTVLKRVGGNAIQDSSKTLLFFWFIGGFFWHSKIDPSAIPHIGHTQGFWRGVIVSFQPFPPFFEPAWSANFRDFRPI